MATDASALRKLVAENVRAARKALDGVSQEKLAEEAGLHRTYVGSIERAERNVSLDNIERLARALRLQPWELLKPRR